MITGVNIKNKTPFVLVQGHIDQVWKLLDDVGTMNGLEITNNENI